jgi:HEPN domain-containing protein
MMPVTREWLEKAEGDYQGALDLRRTRRPSNRDLVCYHCQQAAEKYLKARLVEAGLGIPKSHDLVLLLDLLKAVEPLWQSLRQPLAVLSAYAVEIRYPGVHADAAQVREAVRITERLRATVCETLGAGYAKRRKIRRKGKA